MTFGELSVCEDPGLSYWFMLGELIARIKMGEKGAQVVGKVSRCHKILEAESREVMEFRLIR